MRWQRDKKTGIEYVKQTKTKSTFSSAVICKVTANVVQVPHNMVPVWTFPSLRMREEQRALRNEQTAQKKKITVLSNCILIFLYSSIS